MATILDTIVGVKREEVRALPPGPVGAHHVRAAIAARGDGVRDFAGALRRPARGDVGLIAEVKKASPSKGVIRADFDPVRIAREYEAAGASCLSVLTDERFFQGSLTYLRAVRAAVSLPLLRKDFVIDERQVLEAAEWGADAILLIVAILDDAELHHLHALAEASGLAALVEVHDEAELARALAAGASCLSVLTDERFFQGSLTYLRAVRAAVSLPLLRKDFVIDERQVLEAAEWGADAILLIVAILDDAELQHLHALAEASGLAALVEVHDEAELARALAAGARLIGVNNRDLRTFTVDLGTTGRIAARLRQSGVGDDVLLVAESGLESRADVARVRDSGARAILVGESLMRAPSIHAKATELLGG